MTVVTIKDTYDGMLVDLSRSIKQRSGSFKTHVILQNARIKGMNRDVMIREWQGPHDEIVSISKWTADALDATPAPSVGAGGKERKLQGFQTDTDISRTAQLGQERVLVAWDAGSPPPASPALKSGLDDETFGSSSGGGGGKKGGWDQFAENERRFGTKTDFDEELYTTKLVRNGEGFKDKERKAEAMAREIMNVSLSDLNEEGCPKLTLLRYPLFSRLQAPTLTCRRSEARLSTLRSGRKTGSSEPPQLPDLSCR